MGIWTLKIVSGGAALTPGGLTATPGDAQVSLSWNASSGATSYNVLRSTVSGSGYAQVVNVSTTAYTNTGLTNGATYYFVVTAVNASGTSGNSNQASATPEAETVLSQSGWTATASASASGEPPSLAIDGNTSTAWQNGATQVGGEWFEINMGAAHTLNQLILNGGVYGGDYPRGYSVSVSSDGVNWGNPVATGNPTASPVTITFTAQTAQYIKVTQTGSATTAWWSEAEIDAYHQ